MELDSLLFKQIFKQNPNPMLIYDIDTLGILSVNQAAIDKYGYSREEFINMTIRDIRPPETMPELMQAVDKIKKHDETHFGTALHRSKYGDQFYMQISSLPFTYEGREARIVHLYDVTDNIRAKEKVQAAYEEVEQHLSHSPLGVVKLDADFRIIQWSGTAAQILGFSKGEVLDKKWFDVIAQRRLHSDRDLEVLSRRNELFLAGQMDKDISEFRIRDSEGDIKYLRSHSSVIREEDGSLKSVLILFENITKTRLYEKELKERNELISFINNLSQSINEAKDYRTALQLTLKQICEFMDWPVGHVYVVDEEGKYSSSGIWYIKDPSRYEVLKEITGSTWFEKGKGFIGKVIEKEKPLTIHNINENERFIRRTDRSLVVNTCFAFPVLVDDKIHVVPEFFTEKNTEPDPKLVEAISSVENQLGRILERSRSREELEKREQKYRRLFDNANDGIFMMRGEKFIDCNDEVTRIFGCGKSEIIGSTPIDFSPDKQYDGRDSREKAFEKIEAALEGEPQVFEWLHKKKNGTLVDAEVSLNKLELSDGTYIQAIVRDLTKQKKAERELQKSEKLFKTLFLKSPAAMCMVSVDNNVVMVNESFEKLFGYTEEEIKNKDVDQFIVSEEERKNDPVLPKKVSKTGVLFPVKQRYTKEGEKLDVMLAAIPIYFDDELMAGISIYIDITKQKEIERMLRNSLKEKEVLLTEIHHRVKNNLAVISALIELQAMEAGEGTVQLVMKDSLLRIRTMALVHETLYQTEDFANIELSEYIEKLVQLNAEAYQNSGIDVLFQFEIENIDLNINQAVPSALILNEMISNALKYAFEDRETGEIRIELHQRGDEEIFLSVSDDGVGLPENFEELREKSMGMTLIDQLTKQLGGDLKIESDDGGTSFRLTFKKEAVSGSSSYHFL